jgi:hypothetical protein
MDALGLTSQLVAIHRRMSSVRPPPPPARPKRGRPKRGDDKEKAAPKRARGGAAKPEPDREQEQEQEQEQPAAVQALHAQGRSSSMVQLQAILRDLHDSNQHELQQQVQRLPCQAASRVINRRRVRSRAQNCHFCGRNRAMKERIVCKNAYCSLQGLRVKYMCRQCYRQQAGPTRLDTSACAQGTALLRRRNTSLSSSHRSTSAASSATLTTRRHASTLRRCHHAPARSGTARPASSGRTISCPTRVCVRVPALWPLAPHALTPRHLLLLFPPLPNPVSTGARRPAARLR